MHAAAPPYWPEDAPARQLAAAGRRERTAAPAQDPWRLFVEAARAGRPTPSACRTLEAIYGPLLRAAGPFVVAQLGQSLDGRIATVDGCSHYINGAAALDHLHRLRACVDAVVVGIGTVVADDPRLTVRRCRGASPARVVIDPRGRLPATARCLGDDAAVFVVRGLDAPAAPAGETVRVPHDADGRLDPPAIVAALAARGLRRLLIEGGATTISHFLATGAVDRLHVAVAPLIIGSGVPGLALPPVPALEAALRPPTAVHLLADGNVLFDCDIAAVRRKEGGTADAAPDNLPAARQDAPLGDRDLRDRRDPARHRHGPGAVGADPGHAV